MLLNLSVILVSYNTKDITSECLTRLKVAIEHTKKELNNEIEVIIVDNDSQDGSAEMIKKDFPWVKLIENKENSGFGSGNNIAMKQAKNDYFLLLNTDCFVEENTLIKALNFFITHPECDVLGGKLTFKDGSFQQSTGFLPTPWNSYFWLTTLGSWPILNPLAKPVHQKDQTFYKSTQPVDWVMGAFFMLKKEVYDKVGGFDEKIFMYSEEVEWCFRIKKAGFKVFYTPEVKAIHLGGASSGSKIAIPLAKEMEGLVYIYKKHYPGLVWYIKLLIIKGCLLRIVAFSLLGKFDRVKAYTSVIASEFT